MREKPGRYALAMDGRSYLPFSIAVYSVMEATERNPYFELAEKFVAQTDRHIFLTGKAGTGKTTFLRQITRHCSKKTAIVAPTGVAAINAGGVTMHTFFQLPLGAYMPGAGLPDSGDQLFNNRQTLLRNLRLSHSKRELMRELELLIIDEVSMLRADLLDAMDVILRHVRKKPFQPFGGVQVLFIGDLYQLPPVVSDKEWQFLKDHYNSPFFFDALVLKETRLIYLELKKVYRQNEAEFIHLLNRIRHNSVSAEDLATLNTLYQPGFQPPVDKQYITLTTHNARADQQNREALEALEGTPQIFNAAITGEFPEKAYPAEIELNLKAGAQIMFIKNDKGEGRRYYNGKLGTIAAITEESISVQFPGEEELMTLEKETWRNIRYQYNKVKDSIEEEELGTFTQYPIRLAWAITIHKSQGLSFDRAIIDAGAAFAPGQVYVALSRLTSLDGLVLRSKIHPAAVQTDPRILAFSNSEQDQPALEQALLEGQQAFIRSSFLQAFQVEGLQDLADQWLSETEKKNNIGKLELREWAVAFRLQLANLVPVAKKTIHHLDSHYALAQENGFEQLAGRTTSAADYFEQAIQQIRKGLQEHVQVLQQQPKTGKYVKELAIIDKVLLLRLEQIRKAKTLVQALLDGQKETSLLELITTRPTQPPVPVEGEAAGPGTSKKSGSRQAGPKSAGQLKKGESQILSLALYRAGKSIPAIAEERNLAQSTIASHLVQFVRTGEIPVDDFVAPDKQTKITEVLQTMPETPLSAIKEALGEQYSYLEIKSVIAFLEFQRNQLTTS